MPEEEIKIYRISGNYVKFHQHFTFTKYVRALTEEQAVEKVLCEVTSEKVLRRKVKLTETKIVSVDECPDLFIHQLGEMN